jgi:hypothetical protein
VDATAAGFVDTELSWEPGTGEAAMGRRKYTREYKLEAIGLIRDRGVSVRQVSQDLGIHENTLRGDRLGEFWLSASLLKNPLSSSAENAITVLSPPKSRFGSLPPPGPRKLPT